MNILIAGVHGFVGSNFVMALKEYHTLYGLDIVAPEKEGVVKTFAWEDIETISFLCRIYPSLMLSFILQARHMIQRISLLHRDIF